MNEAYVHGVGVATAGLADWQSAQPVLRGDIAYEPEPLPPFRTQRLPRNESRRMGAAVKLAFRVAEQVSGADDMAQTASVFASAAADITIADRNCNALMTESRALSPTQFHNSVHNAAAGYWSIATGSQAPATSLSGGRDSFAVALCEAWGMMALDDRPVLLVCFEVVGSGMLQDAWRDIHDSFASALLLSPSASGALARLSRPQPTQQPATTMVDPALEHFRQCNPAAHVLPLLASLACESNRTVALRSEQGNLGVEVQCPV